MTRSVSPSVGSKAASAGRSIPGMVRSASLAMAISAPVLPADRAASALPSFTALIAMPIEVVLARRIAWLGFSLASMASVVWMDVDGALEVRVARQARARSAPRRRTARSSSAAIRCGARGPCRRPWPPGRCRLPWRRSRCAGWRPSAERLVRLRSGLGRDDLAAVIVAAGRAQVVRQLQLAAIRAFLEARRLQRMMAAAHVALRRRSFSLGDGHCGTCLSN